MKCRHCNNCRANRPRGLCWGCYYQPGVREKYPVSSIYAKRGIGNVTGGYVLPSAPTQAEPGTPEKLLVLESRALEGVSLFHPHDKPMDTESRKLGVA